MRFPCALVAVAALGCARGGAGTGDAQGNGDRDAADIDGDPQGTDAPPHIDAAPGTASHLLLTEVCLAPSTGELIEVTNPTAGDISLAQYYLADNGNYFRIPTNAVTVDSGDFIVRFPNAVIPAHGVITVAIDTDASFTSVYGAAPTYSIASHTMTTFVATGTPTLTNTGEPVVLFHWDGQSDLVSDVDIVYAGAPSATNMLADKSGVAIDGPDTGSTTTAYKTDVRTMLVQTGTPGSGMSTKRIALESGHESQGGSANGITGDDETSEDLAATWDTTFTAPTPGAVPPALLP
jgi:hypothetical protein